MGAHIEVSLVQSPSAALVAGTLAAILSDGMENTGKAIGRTMQQKPADAGQIKQSL
jgi:hypothetical protein